MTTQADFDAFVESQRGVRRLVLRDLAAWWASVDHLSPSEIQREAEQFVPLLAQTYGEVSATAAADFYDVARGDSVARGRFTATMGPNGAAEQMSRRVRWGMAPAFSGDPAAALGRLSIEADASALQAGRDTVMFNANRDPSNPRWARVPVGKTCAWCLMLASRGPVYRSADSAGAAGQYHGGACDCQPTPSWDRGKDLPPSYDEGGLYGLYDRARANAKSGDPRDITAAVRRLDGGVHVEDGVKPNARRGRPPKQATRST